MSAVRLPPPAFLSALLRRAAGLWALLRIAVLVVGVLAEVPIHDLVYLSPSASGVAALLAAWLTMFDARRRGEVLFLADLAVSPGTLAGLALAPPALGELVVGLVGAR